MKKPLILLLLVTGSLQSAELEEKGVVEVLSLNDQLRAAVLAENYNQAMEVLEQCAQNPGECDLDRKSVV